MQSSTDIIDTTKSWIEKIVIGLNFCPFAAQPFKSNSIHYEVIAESNLNVVLGEFSKVCNQLLEDETIETSLIILSEHFDDFEQYLDMIDLCEQLLIMENLEGVFQVASFHPQYLFAGSNESDASNYTNRSPFPMIHILREYSLTTAIDKHIDVDAIPENNIKNARNLGIAYFKATGFFKS
ncbi:MAG: DUF1415 domain-containing protein [Sphingobacteriales bacterium]|nr:DUF1415 domain-containing protein [Sphingobacteriales bacterium]